MSVSPKASDQSSHPRDFTDGWSPDHTYQVNIPGARGEFYFWHYVPIDADWCAVHIAHATDHSVRMVEIRIVPKPRTADDRDLLNQQIENQQLKHVTAPDNPPTARALRANLQPDAELRAIRADLPRVRNSWAWLDASRSSRNEQHIVIGHLSDDEWRSLVTIGHDGNIRKLTAAERRGIAATFGIRSRGRRNTDEWCLVNFAKPYADAIGSGSTHAIVDVLEALNQHGAAYSRNYVRDMIRNCRQRDLLTNIDGNGGRAGGQLTDKALKLLSEIAEGAHPEPTE